MASARWKPLFDAVSPWPKRAFWVSMAVSLALHAVLLSELTGVLHVSDTGSPELTAELQPAAPPPPPGPPKVPPKPAPRPAKAIATAQPQPMTRRSASPLPSTVPSYLDEPEGESRAPSPPAEATQTEPVPRVTDAEPALEPPAPVATDETKAETAPPQAGTITYELFFGTEKFSIGRSVQTWTIDKDSYRLTSFSETTGLVGLFRPYLYAYVSEGNVDASGLRPRTFSVRRGRQGERQAVARFDWEKRELTLGPLTAQRKVPLQEGTYDFLSFIYQLGRTPLSPGRMQLVITTGTKVETYLLDIGAEEDLRLPLGTVRAVPIRQIRMPGEESVELWLSNDRPRLPLRIRFLDKEGRMTVDQLANKISTDGA